MQLKSDSLLENGTIGVVLRYVTSDRRARAGLDFNWKCELRADSSEALGGGLSDDRGAVSDKRR